MDLFSFSSDVNRLRMISNPGPAKKTYFPVFASVFFFVLSDECTKLLRDIGRGKRRSTLLLSVADEKVGVESEINWCEALINAGEIYPNSDA